MQLLKYTFYFLVLGIALLAFLFFGSEVALPLLGLFFIFIVLVSYLKSHTIAVEQIDHSISDQLKHQRVSANQKTRSIPADPKVLAVLQRRLQSGNKNKSGAAPIKLQESVDKDKFEQIIDSSSSESLQNEKIKVTISSGAKSKFSSSIGEQKALPKKLLSYAQASGQPIIDAESAESSVNKSQGLRTDSNQAAENGFKPQQKNTAKIGNFAEKAAKPLLSDFGLSREYNKKKSIFDELSREPAASNQSETAPQTPVVRDQAPASTSKNMKDLLPNSSSDLISRVKSFNENKEYDKALAAISEFQGQKDFMVVDSANSELLFQEAISKINAGLPAESRTILLEYFEKYISSDSANFEKRLAQACHAFRENKAESQGLPLFITLLGIKRSNKDLSSMDKIYDDIIAAYTELDEVDKIIESYQNQLAIKNNLNDFDGQLEALDKLGKIYYEVGDKIGVNFCYSRSMEIRQKMLSA